MITSRRSDKLERSCMVLGAPRGEIPPGDSTRAAILHLRESISFTLASRPSAGSNRSSLRCQLRTSGEPPLTTGVEPAIIEPGRRLIPLSRRQPTCGSEAMRLWIWISSSCVHPRRSRSQISAETNDSRVQSVLRSRPDPGRVCGQLSPAVVETLKVIVLHRPIIVVIAVPNI